MKKNASRDTTTYCNLYKCNDRRHYHSSNWFKADKTVAYLTNGKNCNIGDSSYMIAEYAKTLIATVLTVKTSNATVNVNTEGANCKYIFLNKIRTSFLLDRVRDCI